MKEIKEGSRYCSQIRPETSHHLVKSGPTQPTKAKIMKAKIVKM